MSDKISILFIGDSLNLSSGFSYVISNLIKYFHSTDKFEISYINLLSQDCDLSTTMQVHGNIFKDILYDESKGARLYNCQIQHEHNWKNIDSVIETHKPKIIVSLIDPWQSESIAYSSFRSTFYWVAYNTIEIPSYPSIVMFPTFMDSSLRKSLVSLMNNANLVIPVTNMGKSNFENLGIKCAEPILCGVDFDKRCIQKYSKQEVFGMHVNDDSFIFMTLGTNTERKRLDLSIEAFNLFLKKVNNPEKYFLYLHTNPNETSIGTDLIGQGVTLGILNKLMFPSSYVNNKIMPQEELFKRISVSDCYIGLPGGEGYGYGLADSMMHGIPLIYINYGGHVEYCKDAGLAVEPKAFYNSKNAYMKWAIADVDQASEHMLRITNDTELRKQLGSKGVEIMKNLSWSNQSEKFYNLVMDNFNQCKKNSIHSKFYMKKII